MKKIYSICLETENGPLYLKYIDHITFTNTVGYLWKNEEKILQRHQEILALNVSPEINSCKVVELSIEEIASIKEANPKVVHRVKGPKADEQEKFKDKEKTHRFESKEIKENKYEEKLDDIPLDPNILDENGELDEMYLFRKLNEHCMKCTRPCKQSHNATIVRCPQFVAATAAA